MALLYNKVQRVNPADREAPPKWYVSLKSLGMIGEKEVAKQLSEETTLNPKEAEMALAQFQKILQRLLLAGHTVQLGDWGFFQLTVTSEGSNTEKDCAPSKVKNINIRFKAGKELREAISKATFKATSELSNKTE